MIASDGGLFSRAEGVQERPYVTLFPFERVEIIEDFGARRDGAQGQELLVARFAVSPGARKPAQTLLLPEERALVPNGRYELRKQLAFQMMGGGLLNGRRFDPRDMMAVADDERLPLGETSVWTFANNGPGMAMSHPIHIHGVHFRVIERSRIAPADLREGIIDTGYKDVVGIFPGEVVRLEVAPTIAGLFMYHCHNLEHEDSGMMRNVVLGSVADSSRRV